MNDQRREPIGQTHEQQSYIDERVIDTEPLPVPAVELSQEQIAADNRAKQERTEAQKEKDELKETLRKMLQMQKESLIEIEKLKKDRSEPSSSSTDIRPERQTPVEVEIPNLSSDEELMSEEEASAKELRAEKRPPDDDQLLT